MRATYKSAGENLSFTPLKAEDIHIKKFTQFLSANRPPSEKEFLDKKTALSQCKSAGFIESPLSILLFKAPISWTSPNRIRSGSPLFKAPISWLRRADLRGKSSLGPCGSFRTQLPLRRAFRRRIGRPLSRGLCGARRGRFLRREP